MFAVLTRWIGNLQVASVVALQDWVAGLGGRIGWHVPESSKGVAGSDYDEHNCVAHPTLTTTPISSCLAALRLATSERATLF